MILGCYRIKALVDEGLDNSPTSTSASTNFDAAASPGYYTNVDFFRTIRWFSSVPHDLGGLALSVRLLVRPQLVYATAISLVCLMEETLLVRPMIWRRLSALIRFCWAGMSRRQIFLMAMLRISATP